MRVEVHIGKLVIDGVERVDRAAVGPALQQELGRLLSQRGLPAAFREDRTVAQLRSTMPSGSGSGSSTLGRRIADAAYRGLQERGSEPRGRKSDG